MSYEFTLFAKCISTDNTSEHDSRKEYNKKNTQDGFFRKKVPLEYYSPIQILGSVLSSKNQTLPIVLSFP